jgi:glycosyltransferase involved in cell wall biosynthesis
MIVKNEARDIVDCLRSVKDHVDEFVIVDTGSTDNTCAVIHSTLEDFKGTYNIFHSQVGMENGKIISFADARNNALTFVSDKTDYIISLDADDRILNSEAIRPACEKAEAIYITVTNEARNYNFKSMRIWNFKRVAKWVGAVHEYLQLSGHTTADSDILLLHHYGDSPNQENGTERNLRIMKAEIDSGKATGRTYFYYGNQLREAGRYEEAIQAYETYFTLSVFHDEKCLAYAYRAKAARLARQFERALAYAYEGIVFDSRWNETWMEVAYSLYELGRFEECVAICIAASKNKVPPDTVMFVEHNLYTEQPGITERFARAGIKNRTSTTDPG